MIPLNEYRDRLRRGGQDAGTDFTGWLDGGEAVQVKAHLDRTAVIRRGIADPELVRIGRVMVVEGKVPIVTASRSVLAEAAARGRRESRANADASGYRPPGRPPSAYANFKFGDRGPGRSE